MDHQQELKQLIEQENVVAKVRQLIDLKVNFYMDNEDENSPGIINSLNALGAELNSVNALKILEMVLDGDFETMGASEIVENVAQYTT